MAQQLNPHQSPPQLATETPHRLHLKQTISPRMPTLIRIPPGLPPLIRRKRRIQPRVVQPAVRAIRHAVLMQVVSVEHLTLLADALGLVQRVLG